jgi:hypothetical protein
MKKQTSWWLTKNLVGVALIVTLLFALQAASVALGGRNQQKSNAASHPATSAPAGRVMAPPAPAAPQVTLYDQLNNPGTLSTVSQQFPDNPTFSSDLADDFVVPSGQTWTIAEVDAQGLYFNGPGPADNFNVFIYQNSGTLPGAVVYTATAQTYVNNAGVFQVTLAVPAVLTAGTYWVEVQAHMSFTPNGEWGWTDRTVQANSPAAWQNPGGGFALCPTWGARTACTGDAPAPDQMYRLIGTLSGGCGTLAWQAAANMPLDFYGGAAASNGTFAYVAGGYSFSSGMTLNSLYSYDPVANAWTTLTPYPGVGFIEAVAVYYPTTNRIYVFGGEDAVSGTNYNNTRIYDIASGAWLADGATMPDVRSFMAGGYISADGNIYILSGYNTGQVTSAQPNTWKYDPVANSWTDLTGTVAYPHPAGGFGYGVINNHIYTTGGRDSTNTVINLTYDFNPAALTYTLKANEPGTNNNVPGSGVAQNALWVFGGGSPFAGPGSVAAFAKPVAKLAPNVKVNVEVPQTTNSTLVYNPATDVWSPGPNMGSIRSFPGGTNIGSLLLAAGGYNGATTVASAETLNACAVPTPTPTPCPGDQYTITPGTDAIVPGTVDSGNHCDDCATVVAIPFPFQLYGNTYNSLQVVSNGFIDFVTPNNTFATSCLPATGFDYTIFPLWHDFRTDTGLSGCTTWANGCGVFTSVSGTAPNRIFNMEWHAVEFANNANTANFEVRLYENGGPANNKRFDIVFGSNAAITATDTSGVQGVAASSFFTQDFCNAAAPSNVSRAYTSAGCGPTVTSAVSRLTHGGSGNFDVNLPLTGPDGVECRTKGGTNDYTMVVTFGGNVTVTGSPQAQVTSGAGCVGSAGVCTGNVTVSGNVVTVPLTTITNAQNINVRINGVNSADAPATDVNIPMGVLWGDTNANRTVNAADIAQTKARLGQTVDETNFRSDVNANGSINAADVAIIKQNSGTSIP